MTVGKIDAALSPLPTLTWNWLDINRAKFSGDFEYEKQNARIDVSELPEGFSFTEDGKNAMPFLPDIPTALGENFSELLEKNGFSSSLLKIEAGTKCKKPLILRFNQDDGTASFRSLVISAGDNVDAAVILDFSSKGRGINAVQTKIFAGNNSKIHLVTVQLLGSGFISLNDAGCRGGENSLIDVTQIELGAEKIFTGVYSTQDAFNARFKNDVAYYLNGGRELDMNFVALQSGKKSDSLMHVYGTLKDCAKKTYRGTIDFKKGCAGATGNEQEETLLLSPAAVNKSIPLILCDEEDVSGEHGATVGRLGEDILFYMNSRGLSLEAAESLMARAKVSRLVPLIGDEETEKKVNDFLDGIFGGGALPGQD